ncbi:MAG: hypothetical protein KJ792_16440 [Actinobacteria bacterium]|nr:hypothetical protein [Actinomycetota bacterium]
MHDEVRMHVRSEQVDVVLLRRAVDSFVDLLRASDRGEWVVSELRLGSIITAARPGADNDIDVHREFDRIISGLAVLSNAPIAPEGWSDDMLKGVADLVEVTETTGVDGIQLSFGESDPLLVTTQTCRNARRALESGPVSLGAVTGQVDRFYSRGNRHELGLVDEATNVTITLRYGRAIEEDARSLIGQRVTAWGLIQRTPGGKKRDMRLDGFKIAAPRSGLGVDDMVGLYGPDWTGGISSVDWVRGQRDD